MISAKRIKKVISPSSGSLSAETIANNNDLLTQILVFLPLKFKCVSKHWRSLISHPDFSRRLNLSKSPCALFVNRRPCSDNIPEFDFIKLDAYHSEAPVKTVNFANEPSGINILHSCNGLFLCCIHRAYGSEENYYVYNPTTEQYTRLPPFSQLGENTCGPYLAFDPSKSPHYKVICLLLLHLEDSELQIQIYSSDTGLWMVSPEILTLEDRDNGFHGGVFRNGALHWYTDYGPGLYFDVDQEQVKEMTMPPKPDEWHRRRVNYFGECGGHLCLVEIYYSPSTQFNV